MNLPIHDELLLAWIAGGQSVLASEAGNNNLIGCKGPVQSLPGFGHVKDNVPLYDNLHSPRKSTPSLSDPGDVSSSSGTAVFSEPSSPSLPPSFETEHEHLCSHSECYNEASRCDCLTNGVTQKSDDDQHFLIRDQSCVVPMAIGRRTTDLNSEDSAAESPKSLEPCFNGALSHGVNEKSRGADNHDDGRYRDEDWTPVPIDPMGFINSYATRGNGPSEEFPGEQKKVAAHGQPNRQEKFHEGRSDEEHDDEDEDEDYTNRRRKASRRNKNDSGTLLACPYFVRDPFKWKTCRQSGSSSIHRVT
jgi:hypothetical protein